MYTIIDIETTGGSPKNDKITEIAIYVYDGSKIIDEFVTLINPERNIPYFTTQMTGISNEMVADAPTFFQVAKKIVEITENRIFVAHNSSFDYNFIKSEFKQLGYVFKRKQLCTVKLSRKLFPGKPSYSLGYICRDFNIIINGRHRAGGDAYATVKLFDLLLKKDIENKPVFNQMANFVPANIKFNFDKRIIDDLPEEAGIYYFYNKKADIIYIGKSKNIQTRVVQHLYNESTKRAIEMKDNIYDISYETTGSELIALLLESDEIKTHKPLYNRAQRRTSTHWGIYEFEDEDGYIQFEIRKNNSDEIPIISYSNRKKNEEVLNSYLAEFNLCQKLCGLYKTEQACFHYQVNQCNGACIGEESPADYNKRVQQLLQRFEFEHDNFYIIDKGRDDDEKSVVRVANGKYLGFGYIGINEINQGYEILNDCIKTKKDTKDAQKIIKSYLKRNNVESYIKI